MTTFDRILTIASDVSVAVIAGLALLLAVVHSVDFLGPVLEALP